MIHKRVETVGVYPLVRPRGVSALPSAAGRGESPLNLSEKLPARQGRTRLRSSSTLGQSVQGNNSFPIDTVGIPRYTYN